MTLVYLIVGLCLAGIMIVITRRKPTYPAPHTLIIAPDDTPDERRFLRLQGAVNFRDIGGYRTHDGHTVRWGRVYRAGALHHLTTESWTHLQSQVGLKLVCDMRGHDEVKHAPETLPEGITYSHVPIKAASDALKHLRVLFFQPRHLSDLLASAYTDIMLDRNAHVFGQIMARVAQPDQLPLVIHCTAGKDRTGVACALLLSLLGVPDETIIRDYTLSNDAYPYLHAYVERALKRARFLRVTADDVHPVLVADARTMRHTLTHLQNKYGGAESYLLHAAGLNHETLQRIRENLLE